MREPVTAIETLARVLDVVESGHLPRTRRRDTISAVRRVCQMAGTTPTSTTIDVAGLRTMLNSIRPALHGISHKTWANIRSLFVAALELAGVIEAMGRGVAVADATWSPLLKAMASDKRLFCGLAAFANWCVTNAIAPAAVDDVAVERFLVWLETKTLCPKPRDVARRVPNIWNEAGRKIEGWPNLRLTSLSFQVPPKRVPWNDFPDSFRRDAEAYLAMRAQPDLFDDRPSMPRRRSAPATVKLQRQHLHSAGAALIEAGVGVDEIVSLAGLVAVERFKTILRHFHNKAGGEPNAYGQSIARTLIQVARFHVGVAANQVDQLKSAAARLPVVPFDLTEKNKTLLRQLESDRVRARLLFLPDQLFGEVIRDLGLGRVRFVEAQVGVAIDILLVAPLRAQNLCSLHLQRHFSEPNGPKGRLILHIPAAETKTMRREFVAELPERVAHRVRWYRAKILPRLGADPNGHLFVTKGGSSKTQETLSQQIVETIADRIGIHMTPHQFRHIAASFYLEANPEDFETARSLLGHASSKTTLIYAGSSSRRASRAYAKHLLAEREALKIASNSKFRSGRRSRKEP